MRRIETERLTMRNFAKEDWTALQEIIIQFMYSPYGRYDHQWPTTDDGIKGICDWFVKDDQYLAVCLKGSGLLVGYVCMNPAKESDIYNIGLCFDCNHHGNGYAYESCKAYLDYTFNELGAVKVVTGTAAENMPSCKLLHKLGMVKTSESKASFYNDENGNPIEFTGCDFELTRQAWIG